MSQQLCRNGLHVLTERRGSDGSRCYQCWLARCVRASARYRRTAKGIANVARNRPRNNARRIYVGQTYIGSELQYPAPREAVAQFARELIEQHREESP